MIVFTVDLETTIRPGTEQVTQSAMPWHGNRVVLAGWKIDNQSVKQSVRTGTISECVSDLKSSLFLDQVMLVGHNLAFDVAHLRANGLTQDEQRSMLMWDTQVVDYLLSGQQQLFPSLDGTARRNGFVMREHKDVEECFRQGKGADHIPLEVLTPYLVDDVLATNYCFVHQNAWLDVKEECKRHRLIALVMDSVNATIEMYVNGMTVDVNRLSKLTMEYIEAKAKAEEEVDALVRNIIHPHLPGKSFVIRKWLVNTTSNNTLQTLLYGGQLNKVVEIDGTERYKSGAKKGQLKTLKVDVVLPAMQGVGEGQYDSVDESTLKKILARPHLGLLTKKLIEETLKYREASKMLDTFLYGVSRNISTGDIQARWATVHPQYNQCATHTGRLSSSNPNFQNMPNNDLKSMFTSRFQAGQLLQVDFKQLEIVELANLSADWQLISDLQAGRDMHNELHKMLYGKPLAPEDRKDFKRRSFLLIYGGGAKALSEQCGISEVDAKNFIDAFFERYPGVKAWHGRMRMTVLANRVVSDRRINGMPVGMSRWTSSSGREYVWYEYPLDYAEGMGFSFPQIKNYPVQGGATGDKVPLFLGLLHRSMPADLKSVLINTVHDSVLIDVYPGELDKVKMIVEDVVKSIPSVWKEMFEEELSVPLSVEMEVGSNWLMKE